MHPSSVSVFDPLPYRARRERIAARVDDGALLLHAGSLRTRSNDTEYRFRPDSDFHYLTGLAEPEAILLLRPGRDPACTLFVLPREPEAERWTGRRVGPEGAAEIYGADAAYPLAALDEQLPRLLDGVVALFTPFTRPPALEGALTRALAHLRRYNRQGKHAPITFHDARHLLGEDRIVKDAAALASLRRAIDASAEGHLSAMRATTPGMFEYELEARVEYEFRRRGSLPGYTTIVGAGANATILHYVENNAPLVAGELVLIDAGAERDNFTGDITRTFPVDGRFTSAQRDLYEIVLAANRAGIDEAAPGGSIDVIHEVCVRALAEGMRALKLCEGSVDEIVETGAYQRYYMHRTSHWLGADVHDAGLYCVSDHPRPLLPGFVFTIEPGLYIDADDEKAPAALRGHGVRIEDDILITEDGHEVLTAMVPKDIAALEAIVGLDHR